MWLPEDDLKDPSSWSSPPLVLLRDIHDGLLAKYDCEVSASPPVQPGVRDRPARDSQDGACHQEAVPLLPYLDRLYVGTHIPTLPELPLSTCGCNKFAIDDLGDHVRTCIPFRRQKGSRLGG